MTTTKIRARILVPVGLTLALLLAAFVASMYVRLERRLRRNTTALLASVKDVLAQEIDQDVDLMSAVLTALEQDHDLQAAWLTRDRERLLALASPLFEEYRARHHITHFSFHGEDRVNFLRVHDPDAHGDLVDRFTVIQAARTGRQVSGLELGRRRTFTLRVARPWRIEGRLVGYLELGEEIGVIIQEMHGMLGCELAVTIDKQYVNRQEWEAGMRLLGRQPNWDKLPNRVICDWTLAGIDHVPGGPGVEVTDGGRSYRTGCIELTDTAGRNVGHLAVLQDITAERAALRRFLAIAAAASLSPLLGLFGLLYVLLGRIQGDLRVARLQAEEETRLREAVRQSYIVELTHQREDLRRSEEGLKQRIAELAEARTAALNMMEDANQAREVAERAQACLRESEAKFRGLFESTDDAVMLLNEQAFLDCNEATLRLFGYADYGDVLGRHPSEISPPYQPDGQDSRRAADERIAATLRNGAHRFEWTHRRVDGTEFPAEVLLNAMTLDGKRILQAIVHDISERKQAEEELRQSEKRHRVLFESSRDAVMTLAPPSWRFTSGNPATVEVFTVKDEAEFTSLGPWELSPETQPDGRPSAEKAKEMIETAMREGSHFFEWTHKRLGGGDFPATVLLTRVELGEQTFLQATVRDITKQKQAEEQRERMLWQQHGVSLLQQLLVMPAPLEDKLKSVTDGIVRLLDADFCRIWLIRPGDRCKQDCMHADVHEGPHVCRHRDRCLHLLASSGRYIHVDGQAHRRVPFGCYKIGRVASDEEHKFLTNDVQTDPRVHNREWARELGLVSFAGYRLSAPGGETLGVLALFAQHPISADEDAILDGLGSTVALVIQRAAAEQALHQAKDRAQQYLDIAGAILVALNEKGEITLMNRKGHAVLGHEEESLIGRNWFETCVPPRIRDEARTVFRQLIRGEPEGVARVENPVLTSTGAERIIIWNNALLTDGSGRIVGTLSSGEDVTEQKQVEEELRQTNIYLENATARANEMAVMAEAASQAKSEFLANMSHEIRTPMTAILGFADLLMEQGDLSKAPKERIDAANTIRRNGVHLLQIINDILDLSKIEAGKFDVEHIACSPFQVVSEVHSLMQLRAEARNLALAVEYLGPIPQTIRSDPTRLRQILINLVGNAIKFTEAGGVRLVVRLVQGEPAAADEKAGSPVPAPPVGSGTTLTDGASPSGGASLTGGDCVLQFDVIDTGIGMTAEEMARLFQPFAQADTSTTRKFGGTGLGLTIGKRLTELLGGTIAVESTPGVGSTFRLTVATGPLEGVPMVDRPMEDGLTLPETPAPRPAPVEACRLAGRILLAEDGPDNQRLISFLLKKAGAQVTVVENGQLAVEQALAARDAGEPFDVILMDMQMPVLDGYVATGQLRRQGYSGPIIALTAHAMASDRPKCLDAGCDDYASKPIDRQKLLALVAAHLSPAPVCG